MTLTVFMPPGKYNFAGAGESLPSTWLRARGLYDFRSFTLGYDWQSRTVYATVTIRNKPSKTKKLGRWD